MDKAEDFCFLNKEGLHFLESTCTVSVYKVFGDF